MWSKHGLTNTPAYSSWIEMRKRCYAPTHHAYKSYGGRGIKVCERWLSFKAFLEDMCERPAGMSLDRINNDGDYEPGNCRWATPKQQNRNRSDNHLMTINGETKCIAEWTIFYGINRATFAQRVRRGWDALRAITTPRRSNSFPGSSNPAAVLTESDIIAIRASNKSRADLAATYGVGRTAIDNIITRHTWKHI